MALDPELGAILKRNAIAARNLAIRHEMERDYGDWEREYRKAGDALAELYRRRPALLGREAKWQ
jgi:hypothetical protein